MRHVAEEVIQQDELCYPVPLTGIDFVSADIKCLSSRDYLAGDFWEYKLSTGAKAPFVKEWST